MEYSQTFNVIDPTVGVVSTIQATGLEEARTKARAMNKNYSVAPVLSKAGIRNVDLREDALIPDALDPSELTEALREVSKAMNIGKPESFHENFARGRGDSDDPLADVGRAFGLEGTKLEAFLKGRD
jgi:hypothetical protein